MLMVILLWLCQAVIGGLPLLDRPQWLSARWPFIEAMLLVIPFAAFVAAQECWPVGGESSFYVRFAALAIAVFVSSLVSSTFALRSNAIWPRFLILVVAAVIPIGLQLFVPALSD
jgi:hypothetical protein